MATVHTQKLVVNSISEYLGDATRVRVQFRAAGDTSVMPAATPAGAPALDMDPLTVPAVGTEVTLTVTTTV